MSDLARFLDWFEAGGGSLDRDVVEFKEFGEEVVEEEGKRKQQQRSGGALGRGAVARRDIPVGISLFLVIRSEKKFDDCSATVTLFCWRLTLVLVYVVRKDILCFPSPVL